MIETFGCNAEWHSKMSCGKPGVNYGMSGRANQTNTTNKIRTGRGGHFAATGSASARYFTMPRGLGGETKEYFTDNELILRH